MTAGEYFGVFLVCRGPYDNCTISYTCTHSVSNEDSGRPILLRVELVKEIHWRFECGHVGEMLIPL